MAQRDASQFDCWCFFYQKRNRIVFDFSSSTYTSGHIAAGGRRHASQVDCWCFFNPPTKSCSPTPRQQHRMILNFSLSAPVDYRRGKNNRKSLPLVVASTGRQFGKKDL